MLKSLRIWKRYLKNQKGYLLQLKKSTNNLKKFRDQKRRQKKKVGGSIPQANKHKNNLKSFRV